MEDGRVGGDRGGCTQIKTICPTPCNGILFMLPEADPDSNGKQMSGGCRENLEGEADLGTPLADLRLGGGRHTDLREVLIGGGRGEAPFRFVDVGSPPSVWKITWGGFHHWVARRIMGKIPR